MGAPKGKRTGAAKVALGVRLDPEVIEWLDTEAERRGIPRAAVAALCVGRVYAYEKDR